MYILGLLLVSFGCNNSSKDNNAASFIDANVEAAVVPTYTFDEFEGLLYKNDDKTYVINFWATWCKPCVKELPYFESLKQNYKDDNLEVILVSLDFPEQVESRLIPFIKKRNLKSQVVLLDDPDANRWIPKVDQNWSGAIPATIIYKQEERSFYEQSFTYDELEKQLKSYL